MKAPLGTKIYVVWRTLVYLSMNSVQDRGGQISHIQEFPQQSYRTLTVTDMEHLWQQAWDTMHVSTVTLGTCSSLVT